MFTGGTIWILTHGHMSVSSFFLERFVGGFKGNPFVDLDFDLGQVHPDPFGSHPGHQLQHHRRCFGRSAVAKSPRPAEGELESPL